MRKVFVTLAAIVLANYAGRDPQPIATVQPTDANATCAMIVAEIEANNIKGKELAGKEGAKVAQNVAGIVIPCCGSGWISRALQAKEMAVPASSSAIPYNLSNGTLALRKKGS